MKIKHLFLSAFLLSCSVVQSAFSYDYNNAQQFFLDNSSIELSDIQICLDTGECYLASGQFDKAIDCLEQGYELNLNTEISSFQEELGLRFLFAMMLAYVCSNEELIALNISDHLQNLLDRRECTECYRIHTCKDEEYVIGPNKEPYDGWCREVVNTTGAALKGVVRGSPLHLAAKESIIFTIDKFQEQARNCCARGGLWKACVGPLARKLHEWKMLGVPADPMWD